MPIKIFFCYAHEDEPLLKKLKTHLRPLQRQGLIDIWYDRDINAGTEWEQMISEHLNTAQIILLLVSPDFIDSDYCYGTEMKRALERHERGEACVIPIILRPVYWQGTLGKLQALPTDAKPITDPDWHNLDRAFFNVAEGIRKVVEEFKSPLASQTPPKRLLVKEQEEVQPSTNLTIDIKTYVERGKQALAQGQGREAAIAYAHAAQLEPENPQVHLGLAEANLALGSYAMVYMACRKVQDLQSEGGLESTMAQALLNLLDRHYNHALQNINNAISYDSSIAYAHALRAYLLRLNKQYYDAERAEARAALLPYGGRFENIFPLITPEQL